MITMFRVVMRMVHCSHFHSDRDPRSFTDLSLRTCSARGSCCSCAAARGPTTLCATSCQTWCSLMWRRATAQSAQPCGPAWGRRPAAATRSLPRPGRLPRCPRLLEALGCSRPCVRRRPRTGERGRTALGTWARAPPTWPGPARTRWHAVALGARPCVRHRLRPICYGTRVGPIARPH